MAIKVFCSTGGSSNSSWSIACISTANYPLDCFNVPNGNAFIIVVVIVLVVAQVISHVLILHHQLVLH